MKKNGKSICQALKQIRKQIADTNGIVYNSKPCTFEGECAGTCPGCEAEVRYIENSLNALRTAGKAVKVAGLSMGLMMLTGCKDSRTPQSLSPADSVAQAVDSDLVQGEMSVCPPNRIDKTATAMAKQIVKPMINGRDSVVGTPSRKKGVEKKQSKKAVVNRDDWMLVGEIACPDPAPVDTNFVYNVVEEMPTFPGGQQKLLEYISENLQYPKELAEICVQGRVICSFIVERDGSLSNIKVERKVDPFLDREALRLVKSMPRWKPGKQQGVPVRVRYLLPIKFRLQ
ncbi:energy transducer TonB [Hoylesella saccharolytica]|uniref:energy transducer TonB n=1 Tax=Hoylesella saccharolytica TaxID=633701 RepID=UPI00046E5F84|nr:energy transducer TonB [Hoylesella saccharolytica]